MATSSITNTITDPSGSAVAGATVVARLMPGPGFRISDSSEITRRVTTTTNGSGAWSLALERNANITPDSSWWEIEEQVPEANGGASVRAISVGSSNANLLASLVTPAANPALAAYLTQAAGDARYLRTAFTLNYVNAVQDYGADNTGVSDATSALNSAISATPNGGTLYIPDGTYLISGSNTITITKRIRITGAGPGTLLRKTGTGNLLVLGTGTSGGLAEKVGLSVGNLSLATETGAGDALVLKGIHRSLFENIVIPSAAGAGLRTFGCLLNTFVSLKVSTDITYSAGSAVHPTHGVSLEAGETGTGVGGSNSNTFDGLVTEGITTSPGIGINIDNADGGFYGGGVTEGNTIGLKLGSGVHGNVVVGMDFESNGTNVSGTFGNNGFLGCEGLATYFGDNANLADGNATFPSLAFHSDVNSGFFRHGANEIGVSAGGTETVTFPAGGINFNDAKNLIFGIATGTKIGTSTSQKIGFWNVTPVAQQILATGAAHTADDVITLLQTLGLCKQS